MNCTHCNREITGYRQSAEIPGKPNHYFIVHDCANVMIAKIVDGELISVEQTPTDDSPETRAMIQQCYELMEAGREGGNYRQVKISETSQRQDLPLEEPKICNTDSESTDGKNHYDDGHCRGCTHEGNCPDEKVEKKENIFKRFFNWIFRR